MSTDDGFELRRLGWRTDAAERRVDALERRLVELERQVQQMLKSDEIAAAVAAKVNEQQHVRFSKVQRRWGFVFGAAVAVGAVAGVAALIIQWVS